MKIDWRNPPDEDVLLQSGLERVTLSGEQVQEVAALSAPTLCPFLINSVTY